MVWPPELLKVKCFLEMFKNADIDDIGVQVKMKESMAKPKIKRGTQVVQSCRVGSKKNNVIRL